MSELSAQKLNEFYDKYKAQELAFNKSIIQALGVDTSKVCMKIKGEPWPCVLYSCSMTSAKIIVNMDQDGFERIRLANNYVNLRLSFSPKYGREPIMFFVSAMVRDYKTFNLNDKSSNAFLMTLDFTTKPSEDLIEILGRVFEMNENFEKRKSLRVDVDEKVISIIGLATTKAILEIEGAKRQCLLKNLSATGVLAVMACNPDEVVKKHIRLYIVESGTLRAITIEGTIMRTAEVRGNAKIYGVGIMFDADKIPYEYKNMLNGYIDKLELIKRRMSIPTIGG